MPRKPRPELLQIDLELSEDQWASLMTDSPWAPLPAEIEEVLNLLPETSERCTRTDILVWCHRMQGLIGFDQVRERLVYEDPRAARKHATSMLIMMTRQGLLKKVHFPADAPDRNPEGVNEGSGYEITALGLLYLRGAILARRALWRWMSITEAHDTIGEEEDGTNDKEVHYLASVVVRDGNGKLSKPSGKGLVNSVFALGR